MNSEDEHHLEDPDNWDYDRAERRPGVIGAQAVVSVTFGREDLDIVTQCAEALGMRTSEFIRQAALERAGHQRKRASRRS